MGTERSLYGAFLKLTGRRCLVVGGGRVAERKVAGLLDCGAVVDVISPTVTNTIFKLVKNGTIRWFEKSYLSGDAAPYFLIIAATSSQEVNRLVFEEAEQHGRLVNVVNDQELGNFLVPAMIRRGKLAIGVSTSGAAPAVAKRIREELEMAFGEEYAVYLDKLADVRGQLLRTVIDEHERTALLRQLASSNLLELLRGGHMEEAERLIADTIGGHGHETNCRGNS
jgi:precorrin-2 dehydrogenase / sirohydrochlorin ferrochelatase